MTVKAPMRGVRRWAKPLAWGLAMLSAALVSAAVVGAAVGGLGLASAASSFVVTNATMALSFSLVGPRVRPVRLAIVGPGVGLAVT